MAVIPFKDAEQNCDKSNICAQTIMDIGTLGPASHEVRIDPLAVVEAFPSSFLGLMIANPGSVPAARGDRSDTYYHHLATSGILEGLLRHHLGDRHIAGGFEAVTNHDDRAALICTLTTLGVACGDYSAVGDDNGWIILPPRQLIQDWGWELLTSNSERPTDLHSHP